MSRNGDLHEVMEILWAEVTWKLERWFNSVQMNTERNSVTFKK